MKNHPCKQKPRSPAGIARRRQLIGPAGLLLLMLPFAARAATDYGTLRGRVVDARTQAPLPGANVQLVGTLLGAGTDTDGAFRVKRVPAGTYRVRVSFIGYRAEEVEIAISRDTVVQWEFSLHPSAILFDQVVVTGSRHAEDLQAAAHSVSVLSQLDVRQRNRFRIDEALQALPSVNLIGENISIRGGTGYSLLGVGASRVLMLIDGIPVLTSDLGRANWDLLPVTELERVEVLKGAGSVLYGSGGITGVVNVITRRPTARPGFAFRQSAGLYDDPSVSQWRWTDEALYYYRTDVSYSNTWGPVGLRLAVSRHYSTSYRENGDFSRWYITARPVITFADGSNLTLFLSYNRDQRGFFLFWRDQNHALSTDDRDRLDVDGALLSAIYSKAFSSRFAMKSRFSFNSQLIGLPFNLTKDFDPAIGLNGELQGDWLPSARHDIIFGVDYKRDIVASFFYGSHNGSAISPYLQDTWQVARGLQISAGVRYETYFLVGDSAETQFSPKLGVSFAPVQGTIFHASIGRGFRAPSIAERFSQSRPGDTVRLTRNPSLRPERSTLFDFGIRQRVGEFFSAEITAFSNTYEDLIELTQISDLTIELQFRNCPRARIRGLETEMNLRLWRNRLGVLANATWLDAHSLTDDRFCNLLEGATLPYRPKFSFFLSPSLRLGPLTVEAEYRYVSRFETVSFFPRDERVPQKVLDVRARLQWKQYMLLLQVKNTLNYNYTVVEQSLGEIRNFSIALSGDF